MPIEVKLLGGVVRGHYFSVMVHSRGWNREPTVMEWKCVFAAVVS